MIGQKRFQGGILGGVLGAALLAVPAAADPVPATSRAFIVVASDVGLDGGSTTVCPPADPSFGTCAVLSSDNGPVSLDPTVYQVNTFSTLASGSVSATALKGLVDSNVPASVAAAMLDTYTVHGTASGAFDITVSLTATGIFSSRQLGPTQIASGASVINIGNFSTDLERVFSFDAGARASQTIGQSVIGNTPFSIPELLTATYTKTVQVGDVFDLGYDIELDAFEGLNDLSHTAVIAFDLPQDVYLTSALGGTFGSAPTQGPSDGVPEPGTLSVVGAGLLLVMSRRRRVGTT